MSNTKKWVITIIATIITAILFWPITPITLAIGAIIIDRSKKKKEEKGAQP